MLPLELDDSWSLYVVGTDKKELLVMDPTETFEGADSMQAKHEENAKLVLRGLIRCIHENLTDWDINGANWEIRYNEGMHMSCTRYGLYQVFHRKCKLRIWRINFVLFHPSGSRVACTFCTTSGSSMGTTSDQG